MESWYKHDKGNRSKDFHNLLDHVKWKEVDQELVSNCFEFDFSQTFEFEMQALKPDDELFAIMGLTFCCWRNAKTKKPGFWAALEE